MVAAEIHFEVVMAPVVVASEGQAGAEVEAAVAVASEELEDN